MYNDVYNSMRYDSMDSRSKSNMNETYYESVPVENALEQRIWEKRVTWWNGDVRVFDLWKEGDDYFVAGPTEFGYRFRQIVKRDGFLGVHRRAAPTP